MADFAVEPVPAVQPGPTGAPLPARVVTERLDPVLRAMATARTDLSCIGPVRESLDRRRRATVADIDTDGVAISAEIATGESRPVPVVTCSEIDPLRDEALDYAMRLLNAGVATELHVFPGTCHGFDSLLPDWEVSEQLFTLQGRALRRVFYGA